MEAKDTAKTSMELLGNAGWDEGGGYMNESVDEALLTQAKISFKAGEDKGKQEGIKEAESLIQFAYEVAKVMNDLKSSNVFFILQQALGDMEWEEAQALLDNVIALGQAFLKERLEK